MKNRVALIGLGNILLKDDGVGVRIAMAIRERFVFFPSVDFIDGGNLGLDLLPFWEDYGKILILDAVDFGREPGYIEEIENDAIPAVLHPKLSAHHVGLSDVMFAAKFLVIGPEEVFLIGIQPESVEVGLEMTERIQSKASELTDRVIRKLETWGINCALRHTRPLHRGRMVS